MHTSTAIVYSRPMATVSMLSSGTQCEMSEVKTKRKGNAVAVVTSR